MSDQDPSNQTPPPYPGQQPYQGQGETYPPQQPQYQQAQYGQPQYGAPQYQVLPKHPQATTSLVLGILGVVLCGVLAPFAWVYGGRAVKEIDANPTVYGGRSEANAGRILGIVGTALLAISVLFVLGVILLIAIAGTTSDSDFSSTSLLGLL